MEVVIALGVTSFALITLVGLLPIGLKNFQSAADTEIQAKIFQQIQAIALQSDFSVLVNSSKTPLPSQQLLFFDERGKMMDSSAKNYAYCVSNSISRDYVVPGTSSMSENMAMVKSYITSRSSPRFTNIYSIVISNNGR